MQKLPKGNDIFNIWLFQAMLFGLLGNILSSKHAITELEPNLLIPVSST